MLKNEAKCLKMLFVYYKHNAYYLFQEVTKTLKAEVIKTVKAAMQSKGISKSKLAKLIGFSYQHIHDLLSGKRRWNEDSIERVCKELGLSLIHI